MSSHSEEVSSSHLTAPKTFFDAHLVVSRTITAKTFGAGIGVCDSERHCSIDWDSSQKVMTIDWNEANGVAKSSLPRENQITDPWPVTLSQKYSCERWFVYFSGWLETNLFH